MVKKYLLLTCIPLLLLACSGREVSPEDEIRQYIDRGIEAAEDRSSGDLADMIHATYRDAKGMNKKRVVSTLRLYFLRHKNIHLFKKIERIHFPTRNEAEVTLHVAMAGNVISSASMLSSLRARVYTFELQLTRQDEWQLVKALWRPADLAAFQ